MKNTYLTFALAIKSRAYFLYPSFVFVFLGLLLSVNYTQSVMLLKVNGANNIILDNIFYYLTLLGDGWFFVLLIIVLFFFKRTLSMQALLMFCIPAFVAQVLKRLFFSNQLRPSGIIKEQLIHIVKFTQLDVYHSFPSGHAVVAFSIGLFFATLTSNKLIHVSLFIISLAVAYSRMYLAQHFLIDISVGAFIGSFMGLIAILILNILMLKRTNTSV